MELSNNLKNFVLNWGEMASHWGLNRTEAQVHALLFVSDTPLTIEEIANTLNVARSNVSTSLKELQNWRIVELVNVMGDRRKHYTALKDVWVMFRNVINEQMRRGVNPFVILLKETSTRLAEGKSDKIEDRHAREQIASMLDFFETILSWYGWMETISIPTVRKYVKLGSRVNKLLKRS